MNGQALGLRKRRKKKKNEAQPSLCKESFLRTLERDWTRIPWDYQNHEILKKCRKGSAEIWTV